MAELNSVGYIGLGNIGKPSALRLAASGFQTHVFDLYQPAVDELQAAGAIACASVAQLARSCSHIGVCVRDDEQVEQLLQGAGGIFANAAPETIVTVHSTVQRDSLLRWVEQAANSDIQLIDAPITGGAHRAADGTLCYMVGGSEEQLARVTPVFETSAQKIVHAGSVGSGIALKLCNNFIQYTEFVAMAEATRLAQACGLSPEVLRDVGLSNGVVNEQMHMFVSGRNSLALSATAEDMDQFFGAMGRLGEKDLDCALASAAENDVSLPTARFIRDRILDVFLARDESRPREIEEQ